jgi:hypothetical protein|nr:hypothetical protein [uncultured Pseudomonas sp.]
MNLFRAMKKKQPQPCRHPAIRKAYYLGLPGEGYACVVCGKAMPHPLAEDTASPTKH